MYVIVSGPPASGKSTLAAALAWSLDLPLLAKDTVKQALLTVLPAEDVAASRVLGRAAVAALLAMAADARCGVLDSVWHRSRAEADLRQLPGAKVEVFCRCGRELVRERYRARSATRGSGHFDDQRDDSELWNEQVALPVAGGWPVIEVDTAEPFDADELASRLRPMLGLPGPRSSN